MFRILLWWFEWRLLDRFVGPLVFGDRYRPRQSRRRFYYRGKWY